MKLLLGSILRVSIRYVYQRGNTYYYQRKIPLDLLDRYGGKQHIKVNLKTNNLKEMAKQVAALNKRYESVWASLRGNPELAPWGVRDSAIKLLDQHGLKPQPADNNEYLQDQFIETLKRKQEAYAQGDEEVYWNADPEEFLDPIAVEALRLLNEAPKFRLSDALKVYLRGHRKENEKRFRDCSGLICADTLISGLFTYGGVYDDETQGTQGI